MSAPRVKIKNSSGAEIPARSFVKVTSSETLANNETVYVVGQPDSTLTGIFFVSGHLKIADGALGYGYDVNFGDAWVKYSTAPTPVEEVGPADTSWECAPTGTGFDAIKVNATSGLVLVRGRGNTAEAASGGSSGGGGLATNNCCSTIYQAGSVDLDGLEWATDYTITLAAPIGTVTVTDQGSGTWESDVVEVTCTVDEVTVTDEYTVTMTATGNAPGEVIVTVALTLGGGYGGAAGCCETTEAGFAWKYVNCCIVDPLAGWSMTRDPSGFTGKECELGGCEICVTPKVSTQKLCALLCYDPDVVWSSAFTTGCTGENTVNVFATKASPIPPNDLEVFGIEYWKVPAFQINSITEIPDPDSACNSCWVDRMNFHISQMNAGILSQGFVAFGGDKDGLASGSAGSGQEEVIYEEFDNTVACGSSTGKLRFTFALCGLTQYISTPSSVGAGRLTFEVFLTYGCVLRASYAFFKPGDAGGIDLESQQQRTLVKVHEIVTDLGGATDYFPDSLTLTPVV